MPWYNSPAIATNQCILLDESSTNEIEYECFINPRERTCLCAHEDECREDQTSDHHGYHGF